MCLGMGNNAAKVIFQIIFINIIFHFLSVKNDFFCEGIGRTGENLVKSGAITLFGTSLGLP